MYNSFVLFCFFACLYFLKMNVIHCDTHHTFSSSFQDHSYILTQTSLPSDSSVLQSVLVKSYFVQVLEPRTKQLGVTPNDRDE